MFKLIAFFAILAAAFAVPAPNPKPDPLTLVQPGLPLTYSAYNPITTYSNLAYNNYLPYAYNYNYYGSPLAYRNLYY